MMGCKQRLLDPLRRVAQLQLCQRDSMPCPVQRDLAMEVNDFTCLDGHADQLLAPHFTEDMYAITTQTGKRLGEEAARAAAAAAAGESAQETDAKKEGEGSAENAASQAHAPEGLRASRQTVMASATLTESVLVSGCASCSQQ
eukprot:651483-Pelagomonas_calceolata.AAC.11